MSYGVQTGPLIPHAGDCGTLTLHTAPAYTFGGVNRGIKGGLRLRPLTLACTGPAPARVLARDVNVACPAALERLPLLPSCRSVGLAAACKPADVYTPAPPLQPPRDPGLAATTQMCIHLPLPCSPPRTRAWPLQSRCVSTCPSPAAPLGPGPGRYNPDVYPPAPPLQSPPDPGLAATTQMACSPMVGRPRWGPGTGAQVGTRAQGHDSLVLFG